MQDVVAELSEQKETAEEEAADLAATLADAVATIEARDAEVQTLKEAIIPMGTIAETPELAVGYPAYLPVRSPAFPSAHRRTASSRCLLH